MTSAFRGSLRLAATVLIAAQLTACSPSPTPSPSAATVTIDAAATAYSAFLETWRGTYANILASEAEPADGDTAKITQYARTVRDAYAAFVRDVAPIEVPAAVKPLQDREIESVNTLVALAGKVVDAPGDPSLNAQFQGALGRVTVDTAAVEAALGLLP